MSQLNTQGAKEIHIISTILEGLKDLTPIDQIGTAVPISENRLGFLRKKCTYCLRIVNRFKTVG